MKEKRKNTCDDESNYLTVKDNDDIIEIECELNEDASLEVIAKHFELLLSEGKRVILFEDNTQVKNNEKRVFPKTQAKETETMTNSSLSKEIAFVKLSDNHQKQKQKNVKGAPGTNLTPYEKKKFLTWKLIILTLLPLISLCVVLTYIYVLQKPDNNRPVVIKLANDIDKPPGNFMAKKMLSPELKAELEISNSSSIGHLSTSHLELGGIKHESTQLPEKSMESEIKVFLFTWKKAWENCAGVHGDIVSYMSCYSDDFYGKYLDKKGWESDKAIKNKKKKWIRVDLKDIRISQPLNNQKVQVNILQDYRSSNFTESSEKSIILRKENAGWKIIGVASGSDEINQ